MVSSLSTGGVPEAFKVGSLEVGVDVGQGLVNCWLLFPVMEALLHNSRELHDSNKAAEGSGIRDGVSCFLREFLGILAELDDCFNGPGGVPGQVKDSLASLESRSSGRTVP